MLLIASSVITLIAFTIHQGRDRLPYRIYFWSLATCVLVTTGMLLAQAYIRLGLTGALGLSTIMTLVLKLSVRGEKKKQSGGGSSEKKGVESSNNSRCSSEEKGKKEDDGAREKEEKEEPMKEEIKKEK